jgi:hypothetical protein
MGRHIVNRLGQRFGKLTVINGPDRRLKADKVTIYWLCLCNCGKERWHTGSTLKRGGVKSCGCSMGQYMRLANRRKNPDGRRQDPATGYVSVRMECPPRTSSSGRTVTTEWRLEHTVMMEQKLGRPLLPTEEVHHKNTIRNDNTPDNLELWVKSRQPKGGRMEDLVSWAVELLRQYRPEMLDTVAAPVV